MRDFLAPSLSLMSLSFIDGSSSLRVAVVVDDAHEVLHLGDHAANGRRVLQGRAAVELVEAEADQRRALAGFAADRAADLLDGDGLVELLPSLPPSRVSAGAIRVTAAGLQRRKP